MPVVLGVLAVILVLLLVTVLKSFGINREYQRAVLFRLGRLGEMKGPGWYWLIPFVDRVVRVDTRIITYQLETQETITRDGVAVRVNAVLWFRAESPIQVVNSVENWMSATVQAAETALRDAIGQSDLDHMLKDRASINERLQQLLREASLKWGVEIDSVEIKDVDIPEQMQRAIAKEAEAIREKRARIIRAEGEQEAAAKLSQAAETIGTVPAALELRRLQTLSEIGVEHNATIVAMLPVELVHAARKIAGVLRPARWPSFLLTRFPGSTVRRTPFTRSSGRSAVRCCPWRSSTAAIRPGRSEASFSAEARHCSRMRARQELGLS